jgi:hypothetical protein
MSDNIDEAHLAELVEECDLNNNGTLDACEIHACLVLDENRYRDVNCPFFGHVYCECPFDIDICIGSWDCDDILEAMENYMIANDSNGDG